MRSPRRSSRSSPSAAARATRAAARTGWCPTTTACATRPPASTWRTTSRWTCSARCTAQGLRPEHYYPELGHGQQEMIDPVRARAAGRRQPRAVPGDGAGHRVPPRAVGEPGAQAHPRPGRQRRPPAHLAARRGPGRRPGADAGLLRRRGPVRPVRDRVPLHRRPARAPARAGRADLRFCQQLPAARAADVEQRLHRLRDGQPGGGGADLLADERRPRQRRSTWS